jgi:hypothetical protein
VRAFADDMTLTTSHRLQGMRRHRNLRVTISATGRDLLSGAVMATATDDCA